MYHPKLDPELFDDVQEDEEEDDSSQGEAAIDDISDVEDMEVQTRKKVKTVQKIARLKDNESAPPKAGARAPTTSSTFPLVPMKSKSKIRIIAAVPKSELWLPITNVIAR